ncbi:MAG: hypothetical protein AB2551_07975 [Candidatus Thiodiazotropha sp.]
MVSNEKNKLIIVIRGWTNTGDWLLFGRKGSEIPTKTIESLQDEIPDSEIWVPEFSLPMFCIESPEDISQKLFEVTDSYLSDRPHIESVILLGYSSGSLLARRLFCLAHGAGIAGEIERPAVAWAKKIHRLVFLAGITRGWEISTASPAHVRFLLPILVSLAFAVGFVKRLGGKTKKALPFIWQLRRGSPFVVTTRIQYVRVIQSIRSGLDNTAYHPRLTYQGLPSTVFLLGARDEFISPADCTEMGPRSEFVFVELPGVTHGEALHISGDDRETTIRRHRMITALRESYQDLNNQDWVLPPEDIDDYLDPMDLVNEEFTNKDELETVQHVVMVIHGIRDNGFWTKRVAREIKSLARDRNISIRAPTPSYGYFSMWDFVRPGGREQATRWFMERYADVLSHFPNASISFVGHSNGTYIAGRALADCPAIHLHRVVFAGSVLRCGYEWDQVENQVDQVLNYVASADNVVAFLPAVFEKLGLNFMDVGGAGAYGFDFAEESLHTKLPFSLDEIEYVRGGHGAAITEGSWPAIANFIVTGATPQPKTVEREGWLKRIYRLAPLVTLAGGIIALIFLVAPIVLTVLASITIGASIAGIFLAIGAILAGLFISWLTMRFLKAW